MDEKQIALKLAELWSSALDDRETSAKPNGYLLAEERMRAYSVASSRLGVSDAAWIRAKRVVARDVCVEPGRG